MYRDDGKYYTRIDILVAFLYWPSPPKNNVIVSFSFDISKSIVAIKYTCVCNIYD